jgi:hypothetical protein
MQLASNTDKDDECSECQPILNHQDSSSFSCEIIPDDNDDDIENVPVHDSDPQCRICLDLGGLLLINTLFTQCILTNLGYLLLNFQLILLGQDLIAPCHCKGTQKYVHRSCLDNWRSTKVTSFVLLHVPYHWL